MKRKILVLRFFCCFPELTFTKFLQFSSSLQKLHFCFLKNRFKQKCHSAHSFSTAARFLVSFCKTSALIFLLFALEWLITVPKQPIYQGCSMKSLQGGGTATQNHQQIGRSHPRAACWRTVLSCTFTLNGNPGFSVTVGHSNMSFYSPCPLIIAIILWHKSLHFPVLLQVSRKFFFLLFHFLGIFLFCPSPRGPVSRADGREGNRFREKKKIKIKKWAITEEQQCLCVLLLSYRSLLYITLNGVCTAVVTAETSEPLLMWLQAICCTRNELIIKWKVWLKHMFVLDSSHQ